MRRVAVGPRSACCVAAVVALALLSGCGAAAVPAKVIHELVAGETAVYHIPPGSQSWLRNSVILTIYGRAFATAPILGRLGFDNSFADMHAQIQPFKTGIKRNDAGRRVIPAVHLIYGLAMPCRDEPNCVLYLDDTGVNIIRDYIKPAQRRHWLVFLDTQLGTSTPAEEIRRMIRKGYLRFDNVQVALDPEFHLSTPYSPELEPGLAFGSITAREINDAERVLNAYVRRMRLPHKKILLVHEFQMPMIEERWRIRNNFHNVQIVINADGLGPPGLKVETYESLVGPTYRYGVRYRGIKLFLNNPDVDAQHTDVPRMTWKQVFGRVPVPFNGREYWMRPRPVVVIIA